MKYNNQRMIMQSLCGRSCFELVSWLVGWLVGWCVGWLVVWLVGWLVGVLVGMTHCPSQSFPLSQAAVSRSSATLASMESELRSIAVLWCYLCHKSGLFCSVDQDSYYICDAACWSAPHLFVDQFWGWGVGGWWSGNGRGQWGMMSMTIHNELQQHEQHRHNELHSNPHHLAKALISTCPIIDSWSTKESVTHEFLFYWGLVHFKVLDIKLDQGMLWSTKVFLCIGYAWWERLSLSFLWNIIE